VIGGQPRMITPAPVEPGTDGAISLAGTLAGVAAAVIVAGAGSTASTAAQQCSGSVAQAASSGSSSIACWGQPWSGALAEQRHGQLPVHSGAAAFALGLLALLQHPGVG